MSFIIFQLLFQMNKDSWFLCLGYNYAVVTAIQSIYSILIWLLHHTLTVKIVFTKCVLSENLGEKTFWKNCYFLYKKS